MTELLISKESMHTLHQIAITSPEKEKAIRGEEGDISKCERGAMREIREGFPDTTCLRDVWVWHLKRKENVLGWGGNSLKTA